MPTVRYTVLNGEVIAEKRNGVRRLYVPDPLGSTVALLDNGQAKTDTFSYWPYGEEASRTGTTPTPFRFVGTQGYYRDRLNSIYVTARHYRPDAGRWLTRDPAGLTGIEVNPYRYAASAPSQYVDPSGRNIACIACGVCVGGAVTAALLACGRSSSVSSFADCVLCYIEENPWVRAVIFGCALACRACVPLPVGLPGLAGGAAGLAPASAMGLGGTGNGRVHGPGSPRYCDMKRTQCDPPLDRCVDDGWVTPPGGCSDCYQYCLAQWGEWPYTRCHPKRRRRCGE